MQYEIIICHLCVGVNQRVRRVITLKGACFAISTIVHQALLCFAGEGMKVVASIHNKSSHDIRPKYCLYSKYSYFAKRKRKVKTKVILKEVGDAIPPSAGQTVTRIITVPPTTCASILNCNIIKAEYRLRVCISLPKTCQYAAGFMITLVKVLTMSPPQVYLDVKYAVDPEIKFPIVILPPFQGPEEEHPTYGSDAFASSDMPGRTSFLQNSTASGPSALPPSSENYGMYSSVIDFNGKS